MKSSGTFKPNPWKMSKKKFIFSKVASSKNELIHTNFSWFLLKVQVTLFMTFRSCVRKPELLPPANRLIYLNISIGISKIHGHRPSRAPYFFTKNNYLWRLPHDIYFMK